jgi:hypothetical protein
MFASAQLLSNSRAQRPSNQCNLDSSVTRNVLRVWYMVWTCFWFSFFAPWLFGCILNGAYCTCNYLYNKIMGEGKKENSLCAERLSTCLFLKAVAIFVKAKMPPQWCAWNCVIVGSYKRRRNLTGVQWTIRLVPSRSADNSTRRRP